MITLTSCISVDYDLAFVPHFVEHYEKLQLNSYKIILHSSRSFKLQSVQHLFKPIQDKLHLFKWVGEFNALDKINKLNKLVTDNYVLTSDIDEFQVWDKPPHSFSNVVWGKLRDREPIVNRLPELSQDYIQDQFPLVTNKTKWGRSNFKPCLYPAKLKLLSPHHLSNSEPDESKFINIDHYRWVKGRLEKSIERLETYLKYNCEKRPTLPNYTKYPTRDLQNVIDEYGEHKKTTI